MPHHLVAAVAAHTWSGHWTAAATGLTSIAFFWLGMLNVTLLAVFLSAVAKRRDLRAREGRAQDLRAQDLRARGRRPVASSGHPARSEDATDTSGADRGSDATRLAAVPDEATGGPGRILLSDAERDDAADLVCRAIAEGRLDLEEGVARVDKVLGARRRATLAPLLADLPDSANPSDPPTTSGGVLALRVAAAALIAGAAVLQALAGVWALWPVAVAALAPLAFSPSMGRVSSGDRTARRERGVDR